MKQPLPLLFLAVLAVVATAMPATAQTIYFDLDGDGECDSSDFVQAGSDTLDVWIETIHNLDGSSASCPTGEDLSIGSYSLVIYAFAPEPAWITYGAWTNAIPQFTEQVGMSQAGGELWLEYRSPGYQTLLSGGKYKLGSLAYTSGGICAGFALLPHSSFLAETRETRFYSACPGADGDHLIRYGVDFTDGCGTNASCDPTPVGIQPTTWGKIKDIYRNR